MRITFVLPGLNMSGGMRIIAIYAKNMQERGHNVSVVAPVSNSHTFKERIKALLFERRWLKYEPEPDSFFKIMNIPVKLINKPGEIKSDDLPDGDIVISCFWVAAEWASKFTASKGKQFHFIQGYESRPGMDTARLDAAWRLPMRKIVISNWLKEIAQTKFNDNYATMVPNSIDFNFFNSAQRTKQNNFTVGFLYNPAWCKASEVAINACKLALKKIPNLNVFVLGVNPPAKNVIPSGWTCFWNPAQDKIPWIYSHCDAWLWTSRQEGFGLPILEAMACRTPVIATRAGAASGLLANGRGIFVDFDDPQGLADAIFQIYKLPEHEWTAISEKAYNYARNYSWDDAADLFEKALFEDYRN